MTAYFSYRKDIDGLRALAILPVVFFHAGLGFTGGYIGVDIFFVISGFLITSIIIREIQSGTFTYMNFWERRIRRIFPASFCVTLITFLVGFFILLPPAMEDCGKAALSQIMMVANFYFWQQDGYFAGPSDLEPFLQMWSLALEEQFYLVLPILLTALLKRGVRKTVLILAGLAFLSFGASCLLVEKYSSAVFFLLPCRAWEFLAGSLLAFSPLTRKHTRLFHELSASIGLTLILISIFVYDKATIFPGFLAILPCVGTMLLIHGHARGKSWVKFVLSSAPFVWVGQISFSLYLWHWPLLAYARTLSLEEPSATVRVSLVILSFVLAFFSWRFIECPYRKKLFFAERRLLFRRFWQATLSSAIVFTVVYKLDGLPKRFKGGYARFAEVSMKRKEVSDTDLSNGKFSLIRPEAIDPVAPFLLWGDSHAKALIPAFKALCEERSLNGFYAKRSGTPPLLDTNFYPSDQDLAPYNDKVLALIDIHKIKTVILASRWRKYLNQGEQTRSTSSLTDRNSDERHPELVFEESFQRTVEALLERGIRVVIIRQVPRQTRSVPSALLIATRFDLPVGKTGVKISEHIEHQAPANRVIDLVRDQATILDPLDLLKLENGHTRIQDGKNILYSDDNHLTEDGAVFLKPLLKQIFDN